MRCLTFTKLIVLAAVSFVAGLYVYAQQSASLPAGDSAASKTASQSASASASTSSPTTRKTGNADGIIASMKLAGDIMESPPPFAIAGDSEYVMTRDWLNRLAAARNDEKVKAVAIEIDSPRLTLAQAGDIADGIRRLNEVKPVYCFIVSGSAKEYILASAGRELAISPTGELEIVGVGAEMMYFRGALDMLGIAPQFVQIGKFKGASESMTLSGPSEEFKGQLEKLLDDKYEFLCGKIAANRKMTVADVKKIIDEGPFSAKSASKHKLVDLLVGQEEWRQHVWDTVAGDSEFDWQDGYGSKPPPAFSFANSFAILKLLDSGPVQEKIKSPTVAIVHVNGVITMGRGRGGLFGEDAAGQRTICEALDEACDQPEIKAVVLRIDSPGGSAMASELIYQSAKRCAAAKPLIVSIGSMGASGGYYVASAGGKILADESAIVGSIGVISGKLAITGLLDKLKISTYETTRGKNAGLFLSRPWSESEMETMRKMAQEIYDTFVSRVKESRKDKIKDINDVAQGRIFSAKRAVENGLVDEIGGLREAIVAARNAAKLETSWCISLPHPVSLLEYLAGDSIDEEARSPLGKALADIKAEPAGAMLRNVIAQRNGMAYLLTVASMLDGENVLAASPYYLMIKE